MVMLCAPLVAGRSQGSDPTFGRPRRDSSVWLVCNGCASVLAVFDGRGSERETLWSEIGEWSVECPPL